MKGNNYLFQDREGNTSLESSERMGLIPSHIQKMSELDEAEALNIIHGLEFLRNYKKDDFLTINFALKLHEKLFSNVWKWAGKFRHTEKNIGVVSYRVQTELYKLFDDMKFWMNNNTYTPDEIGARFHHRLVWIHPFSNGNGRWARIYTEFLYRRFGWGKPNWHFGEDPHQRRHGYIEALRAADQKDFEPLIKYMKKNEE